MALKGIHRPGDLWVLPEGRFTYRMEVSGDRMLFEPETGDGDPLVKAEAWLEEMQAKRKARRVRQFRNPDGSVQEASDADELPPEDASDYGRTLRFFLDRWDKDPCGKGTKALDAFVALHAPSARRKGIAWQPSAGALRRAINGRGHFLVRPARILESRRGKVPRQRWPAATQKMLRRTEAWYYARRERTVGDAYARLFRAMRKLNGLGRRRMGGAWQDLRCPSDETVRSRILLAESLVNLQGKFGEREGRSRWKATGRGLLAEKILDIVLIDGTTLDGWCVLDDRYGRLIPCGRPTVTLAIDLWSRCVLGVIISYEGESLDAIMACQLQVVTGKHEIMERLPHLRDLLEDLHGKPETIVVDNAWRQTGVSYQDANADAGIDIEWAPVKNPEWKAYVETFWQTLNRLLIHKLPGGVPFGPELMRKLGLDPAKTATLTLSKLEELVYQAIFEVYHGRPHRETLLAPLVAWRQGLAAGRETIDDVEAVAAAFGTVGTATLDRQGIRFKGFRFHDPEITQQLLADLAPHVPVRDRRRRLSSASVKVKVKYMNASIAEIQVWNPKAKPRKRYVSLPNWDRSYASLPGLGFWHHERIKDWAKANNLAFASDEDRILAHDNLRAMTENAAPEAKIAAMRQRRRLLEPMRPTLPPAADAVSIVDARPGIMRHKPYDLPVEMAAHERDDEGMPEKGPRRGGRRKGKSTAEPAPKTTARRSPSATGASLFVDDADATAVMAEMAERLGNHRTGK
jgi:putative transposase